MNSFAERDFSAAFSKPSPLSELDPERVRMRLERSLLKRYVEDPGALRWLNPPDASKVRRHLMARSLRITESMAKNIYERAREAAEVLGVSKEIEIYQSSGPENAQIHLVDSPVLLELQGRLLPLLDDGAALALFGHELGHYLAHGPSQHAGVVAYVARQIVQTGRSAEPIYREAQLHCLATELTADRFALLACQDLNAALRLEMVAATGLAADMLTLDTEAYLAQCHSLCEGLLAEGEGALGSTHPEHSVRAYALSLFSETDLYRELTGKGPGSRTLDEVDAILEALLGATESDGDPSLREEPPRELHECALAGTALVALADGELAEEETGTIERIFAPLIPEWTDYLDEEVARERFIETAPLIIHGGYLLKRSLFQLLFHVMISDRAIERAELQMIVALGDALGAGGFYRRWLDEGLRAIGQTIDPRDFESDEPPLPVDPKRVKEALQAFISCVQRRGHGHATARRLLRLMGLSEDVESLKEAKKNLARAMHEAQIRFEPSLDEIESGGAEELDAPIVFTHQQKAEGEREGAPRRTKEVLERAVQRLRDTLVSGDGRSPSVRLRKLRHGRSFDLASLDRVVVGRSERILAQIQGGQRATLLSGDEVGERRDAKELIRELVALDRENRAREEETGAKDLFLGTPFVIGSVRSERQVATPGYALRAPLLLHRVRLIRQGGGELAYSLAPIPDEPPIVNQSLLRLLFNKKNMVYGEALAEELDQLADTGGLEAVLARLREAGVAIERGRDALIPFANRDEELEERDAFLEIEPVAILGLFPQSNSDLLHDYDSLLEALNRKNADLGELFASASALLPAELRPRRTAEKLEASSHPVVAADPSQLQILAAARDSEALVVDGPPGSGKSQVIVNLVADALSRGERVAVVCEKRAAIDVVAQRLDAVGFGEVLALVHDVKDDRKALYERLKRRLSNEPTRDFSEEAYRAAEAEAKELDQELGKLPKLLASKSTEPSFCVGELMTLAALAPEVAALGRLELSRLDADAFERWREQATAYWAHRDLWAATSYWSALGRMALDRLEVDGRAELVRSMREAAEIARTLELARQTAALSAPLPSSLAPLLNLLAEALEQQRDAGQIAALSKMIEARLKGLVSSATSLSTELQPWREASTTSLALATPIRQEIPDTFFANTALLLASAGSFFRFFSLAWWKARSTVRRALASFWSEKLGVKFDAHFLNDLMGRLRAGRGWKAIDALCQRLGLPLPNVAQDAERIASELERSAPWVDRLADDMPALSALHAAPALPLSVTEFERFKERIRLLREVLHWEMELKKRTLPLKRYFQNLDELATSAHLDELADRLEENFGRLVESDEILRRLLEMLPESERALRAFEAHFGEASESRMETLLLARWARDHLSLTLGGEEKLHAFAGRDARKRRERARRLRQEVEARLQSMEVQRILSKLDEAPLLNLPERARYQRRTPEQAVREQILKECSKQRRLMPLRAFVRSFAGEGLLELLPVWLLSPETMAVLFPREAYFDRIIIDEASQCTVESGFPALMRAKSFVVVGDEKQMPPSRFFQGGSDDEEEFETEQDDDGVRSRELFSSESLLTLSRSLCRHEGLKWHYRSKDESLIAFSNHAMYGAELLTIPASTPIEISKALRWVHVEGATYDKGRNPVEAERVVDLLDELLAREEKPSIGVVTFNIQQRRTILDAIDERLAADPRFRRRWEEANAAESIDERPFVKNLESVQGDERDIIVFSLGHAPVARKRGGKETGEFYVPARFGPLGQRGGERRLNVAISRAKSECIVVSSFDPGLLNVGRAKHEGPRLFKEFLMFAYHTCAGDHELARAVLRRVSLADPYGSGERIRRRQLEDYLPLSAQIGLALEERGHHFSQDVGASSFRVPLAVHRPDQPQRFALAVLTNEGREARSVFESAVHFPAVLASRGWKIPEITPAEWMIDRDAILDELERLLNEAQAAAAE